MTTRSRPKSIAANPPKSLRKKSVASSNLHQLLEEDKVENDPTIIHSDLIEAFKQIHLNSQHGRQPLSYSNGSTLHQISLQGRRPDQDASTPSFLVQDHSNEHNILDVDAEEAGNLLGDVKSSNNLSPQKSSTVFLMPVKKGLEHSSNTGTCTSLDSNDSGLYSEGSSKRPSIELTSPDAMSSSCNISDGRTDSRGEIECLVSPNEARREILQDVCEDGEPSSRQRSRVNVDEEAFSELVKAALKLVSDVRPNSPDTEQKVEMQQAQPPCLKDSLKNAARRKSHLDPPTNSQQAKKPVTRKKSAEPFLQSSRSVPVEGQSASSNSKSRKMSACIICDRKKRDSYESCIIRTPMLRHMQERSRFSEVLQVYKPGEIPYMELVVPKIGELKTPIASLKNTAEELRNCVNTAEELRNCVDTNMPAFVRLTNWNSLYAYLVSKQLLDLHMREYMLSSAATQQQKGNKFYGEYLPSHGNHGYQRLLECLKEEAEHTGHVTLVRLLEGGD